MQREDTCGIIGAFLCAFVGWYDAGWRPFWYGMACVLGVWTAWSIVTHRG